MTTTISWTDETWNPTVGCSIVSPGCTNCYAMKMAHRIENMQPEKHYAGTTKVVNGNTVWTGKLALAPEHILLKPLSWKKPRRIFVNSMSDLFHEDVPDEWIDKVFAVMALCPQHTFQVLTKRSKRMREWIGSHVATPIGPIYEAQQIAWSTGRKDLKVTIKWPLPNAHLGVSCEDQTRADERIPDLLATPAAVRFVSAEPMLGPIDFWQDGNGPLANGTPTDINDMHQLRYGSSRLDWIIAGGESGSGFRPMQIAWAESLRRQCADAGAAFFFKQDSAHTSGQRGRASDTLWACKQFPKEK
jgi:protein gp37